MDKYILQKWDNPLPFLGSDDSWIDDDHSLLLTVLVIADLVESLGREYLDLLGFHNTEVGEQLLRCILKENDGKMISLFVVGAAEKLDFGSKLLLVV